VIATASHAYERHADRSVAVAAPNDAVFALLDDPHRLAAHMERRSWRMAWGRFVVRTDDAGGRAVGSHIGLTGRVLGLRLGLDEVVVVRDPPREKRWETTAPPRLLVIGPYRLGFRLDSTAKGSDLQLAIEYDLPGRGLARAFGRLFADLYARWCLRRMADEACQAFPDPGEGTSSLALPAHGK
jgi:hypothetical protein